MKVALYIGFLQKLFLMREEGFTMRLKYDVDTKILFQIGDPLDQCCATYLHNALYEFANINAVNLSVPCT